MQRHLLHLLLLLSALSYACTSDEREAINADNALSSGGIDSLEAVQEEPVRKGSGSDTTDFSVAFGQFFAALQAADTAALNRFIHPQLGMWPIEQPGAVPAYTHFRNIQAVQRSYRNQPFTSVKEQMQECRLQERQELPQFNCAWMDKGRLGYAADGCFYHNTTGFNTSDMWKYASLSLQQQQQVQRMQQLVQKTVLHTRSSYRFHFGYSNGRWRLLFADLRAPCSA